MVFAHDIEEAMLSAVALINSAEPPDTMVEIEQLGAFLRKHDYTGRMDRDDAELAAVRALRPELRGLLLAERDDAAQIVTAMLREANALPRLVRHDHLDWHVHAVEDDEPLATRITVETAMSMIELIRDDELSRLAVCVGADCHGVVLDLSRNRSRKFCSSACGNRAAVAAYRARQAD